MPLLYQEHGLSAWYQQDLHAKVKKYFLKFFLHEMIRVSKEEAFPNLSRHLQGK
jgi:hypothetical protein